MAPRNGAPHPWESKDKILRADSAALEAPLLRPPVILAFLLSAVFAFLLVVGLSLLPTTLLAELIDGAGFECLVGPACAPQAVRSSAHARRTYRVRAGDTYATIAEAFFGDAGRGREIYEANRDRLALSAELAAGTVLVLPED